MIRNEYKLTESRIVPLHTLHTVTLHTDAAM